MPAMPSQRPGCPKAPSARPLPNPAAVRLCLVPDVAPPYDTVGTAPWPAQAAGPEGRGLRPPGQPPGQPVTRGPRASGQPLDRGQAPGQPGLIQHGRRVASRGTPGQRSEKTPGGQAPGGQAPEDQGPGEKTSGEPARRPALPAPGFAGSGRPGTGRPDQPGTGWPSRFAQVLAETLAGSRPPRQITPWTTQRARDHIQRLGPQLMSAQRPMVRRVVTSRPADDVMEMAVIVGFGARVRALAVRLERAGPPPTAGRPAETVRWLCTAVEAA